MQRAKVVVLREGTFIVPEPALEWLTEQHVAYTVLQRLTRTMSFRRYEILLPPGITMAARWSARRLTLR